jgi:hypothetical protein
MRRRTFASIRAATLWHLQSLNDDPPTPPAIRPYNPLSIPGWPADFQPQCQVTVFFQVNLTTQYGQNVFMSGNVTALGTLCSSTDSFL